MIYEFYIEHPLSCVSIIVLLNKFQNVKFRTSYQKIRYVVPFISNHPDHCKIIIIQLKRSSFGCTHQCMFHPFQHLSEKVLSSLNEVIFDKQQISSESNKSENLILFIHCACQEILQRCSNIFPTNQHRQKWY